MLAIGSGSSRSTTPPSVGTFAFGSEVKALIQAGYRAAVSPVGLAEYFTFQNILSDATLFDGVRMLPAGHFLQIREDETRSTSHALLGSRVPPGRVRVGGGVGQSRSETRSSAR